MRDGKPSREEEDAIQQDQLEARIHATRSNKRKRNDRTTKTGGGAAASPSSSSCDDADDAAVSLCDDVTRSIFARLPARTVVASMALSKDHRRLMRCPDFRSLHCRLSPPLPRPHIAYVATAKLRRCPSSSLSGFHGFHVAGAGLNGAAAPMRSLAGPTYVSRRYVNTCNGVLLLSGGEEQPNTCVLWNPAVADEEKEVAVPVPARDDCVVLGLGYGSRSQTYKLLLSRRQTRGEADHPPPVTSRYPKELMVFTLGGGAATESRALRTVLSAGVDGEISTKSLYIDGVIYLLHVYKSLILAFDVDDEKVTAIDLPGKHKHAEMYELNRDAVETVDNLRRPMSNLMELAGRPCVETCDDNGRALWLLTEDRRWEERYVSWCPTYRRNGPVIAGAWDCGGGVLVTYLHHPAGGAHRLLCVTTTNDGSPAKTFGAYLPRDMTPEWPDYAFCWGYKPTLVSPGSIVVVGNLSDEREERRRASMAHLVEALKPVNERDKRKGHKATLNTVCFMEFLARFMQNKPQDMHDLIATPPFQSDLVLEIH